MGRANAFEKRLARQVFAKQKKFHSVPVNVRASARRVLEGTGSSADVTNLRNFLGVFRSGSSAIRGARSKFNRAFGGFSRITQNIELAQQAAQDGRNTAQANARLIGSITFELNKVVKSKLAKRTSEAILKTIGRNPARATAFLNAISRGLKLGGAIAAIAGIGFQSLISRQNQRGKIASLRSQTLSLNRSLELNPQTRRREEKAIQQEVLSSRSGLRKVLDFLGFDEKTQTEIQKKTQARLSTLDKARGLLGQFGIDRNDILGRAARRKNKIISELTSLERKQALDDALQNSVNPNKFNNDPRLKLQLQREFMGFNNFGKQFLYGIKSVANFETQLGLFETESQAITKRREELKRQFVEEELQNLVKQRKDRQEAIKKTREQLADNPAKMFKFRDKLAQSDSVFRSFRSRHSGWNND